VPARLDVLVVPGPLKDEEGDVPGCREFARDEPVIRGDVAVPDAEEDGDVDRGGGLPS
jgi:hypothetical protein